mmetsp:Transcript_8924/g.17369  ORF Transcript_8924/g.17369 Transcript_8924/m.17369 type:complete len:248 (-) Transcript_8924:353-1096(-)
MLEAYRTWLQLSERPLARRVQVRSAKVLRVSMSHEVAMAAAVWNEISRTNLLVCIDACSRSLRSSSSTYLLNCSFAPVMIARRAPKEVSRDFQPSVSCICSRSSAFHRVSSAGFDTRVFTEGRTISGAEPDFAVSSFFEAFWWFTIIFPPMGFLVASFLPPTPAPREGRADVPREGSVAVGRATGAALFSTESDLTRSIRFAAGSKNLLLFSIFTALTSRLKLRWMLLYIFSLDLSHMVMPSTSARA